MTIATRMAPALGLLLVSMPVFAGPKDESSAAQPTSPPPKEAPSPPPETPPPSPPQAKGSEQPAPSSGQWVFTEQYGWIWMPYGDAYSYAPEDGKGEPYVYVYYPAVGWTWVVAPWIWGWGPLPHCVLGCWHFRWYGHGWGPAWRGFRPAPYRRGFVFHGYRRR